MVTLAGTSTVVRPEREKVVAPKSVRDRGNVIPIKFE